MNDLEKQFLAWLNTQPKGRCGYSLTDYDKAMPHLKGLIAGGYMKERRLGSYPGFQITDKGREWLGGLVS